MMESFYTMKYRFVTDTLYNKERNHRIIHMQIKISQLDKKRKRYFFKSVV